VQILSIGKKKRIYAIGFSPSGRDLAAVCGDGFVRIWDTSTGKVLQSISVEHSSFGYDLAFLDENRLAVSGTDLRWWDIPANGWNVIRSSRQWMVKLCVSPDGRYLADIDRSNTPAPWRTGLNLHDMRDQSLLPAMENAIYAAGGAAFSSDGKRLATGHMRLAGERQRSFGPLLGDYAVNVYEYVVHVREAPSGNILHSLDGWTQIVSNLGFSQDGKVLAGTAGGQLRIMDIEGKREIAAHKRGTKHFQGLSFTAEGSYLVTVSNDETVRVWETRTWQEHTTFNWKIGRLLNIAMAPDGLRAAAGSDSGKIVIWDLEE
jgi:WD40 repeat protein